MAARFLKFLFSQTIQGIPMKFPVAIGPVANGGNNTDGAVFKGEFTTKPPIGTQDRATSPLSSPPLAGPKAKTQDRGTSPFDEDLQSTSATRKSPRKPSGKPQSNPAGSKKVGKCSPTPKEGRVRDGRILKKWPKGLSGKRSRGLANLGKGFFCYRNSMLQCLFHQPAIYQYLDRSHRGPHPSEHYTEKCIKCAMQEVLQTGLWLDIPEEEEKKPAIKKFNEAVLHETPLKHDLRRDFQRQAQSDSFDFLVFILERLRQREIEDEKNAALEAEGEQAQPSTPWAPTIEELFDITLERRWTCEDCNHETVKEVPADQAGHGVGLQVNLLDPQKGLSLVQYLRANVFTETVEVRCEDGECTPEESEISKPREQRRYITKAPEILIVRLDRFATTMDRTGACKEKKIAEECRYEEYLNVGEFTEEEAPLLYRLDGVVAHQGNIHSGHNIAAVRERNGKYFCSINDNVAIGHHRGGTVEELERPVSIKVDFDPYVLVYSKV